VDGFSRSDELEFRAAQFEHLVPRVIGQGVGAFDRDRQIGRRRTRVWNTMGVMGWQAGTFDRLDIIRRLYRKWSKSFSSISARYAKGVKKLPHYSR